VEGICQESGEEMTIDFLYKISHLIRDLPNSKFPASMGDQDGRRSIFVFAVPTGML